MTPPLFFLDELPGGDLLVLAGDEGRHAARVKRLQVGEQILVGDGRGTVLTCVVGSVGSGQIVATVESRQHDPSADPRLIVVQALPKGERAELVVELLTELGADEIVPWSAARSVGRWPAEREPKALQKWRRTAREAAKQSRRPWVPDVTALVPTGLVVARLRAAATALVLHESATQPLAAIDPASSGDVVLVVGPEGGISDDELTGFEGADARIVRLGAPVLRTSTAGAAALAALSARLGRWN